MILEEPEIKPWSFTERVLFRFIFINFSLFIILVNNGAFPFLVQLTAHLTKSLHSFIPWFAENFLALSYPITIFSNGSGDTTYDYVVLLCIFLTAFGGCLIWSLIDRKRLQYDQLFYILTVLIRFYVGLMLIQYGLGKVVKIQFPFPDLNRLTSTYGESTPMGLAWTFMGFSKGYICLWVSLS